MTNMAVLLIDHRHGINTYVCADEATAKNQLGVYVDEWWDHESRLEGATKPDNLDERIEAYFGAMDGEESYTLSTEPIIIGGDKVNFSSDTVTVYLGEYDDTTTSDIQEVIDGAADSFDVTGLTPTAQEVTVRFLRAIPTGEDED